MNVYVVRDEAEEGITGVYDTPNRPMAEISADLDLMGIDHRWEVVGKEPHRVWQCLRPDGDPLGIFIEEHTIQSGAGNGICQND